MIAGMTNVQCLFSIIGSTFEGEIKVNDYAQWLIEVDRGQRKMYDAMQHKDYELAINTGLEMMAALKLAINAVKLEQENKR